MSTRLSAKERRRVFARLVERDGAACVHCGVPHRVIWRNAGIYSVPGVPRGEGRYSRVNPSSNLEIEHRRPFAAGGSNALSNLRLMCGDCHKQKTAADRRTPA